MPLRRPQSHQPDNTLNLVIATDECLLGAAQTDETGKVRQSKGRIDADTACASVAMCSVSPSQNRGPLMHGEGRRHVLYCKSIFCIPPKGRGQSDRCSWATSEISLYRSQEKWSPILK